MIYHVYANQKNIGDWLSARAIQSLIGRGRVVELFCDEPFVKETLAVLATAGPRDLVVIGGGGLFMDYFVPFWEGFLPIAPRVQFCIWGVGYCDMKDDPSRAPIDLLEQIVHHSTLCIVRDELTRQHLIGSALAPPVCCPTINLISTRPPGIGLLHVDTRGDVGEANYALMEACGRDCSARSGIQFQSMSNEIPAGSEKALMHAIDLYASSGLVMTARLHGCIIGLAMGRKVLAVSCDRKIESFMNAAGLASWVIDVNDVKEILPLRLDMLSTQPDVSDFISSVRSANAEVGRQVQALANLAT